MALRTLSFVLAALYVFAIYLQHNDPDPQIWMPYYGACAVASIAFGFGRLRFSVAAIIGLFSIAWCAWLATGVLGRKPLLAGAEGEEGREMFGLFVSAVWFFVLAWRLRGAARPIARTA